uniref:NADH dehydrogenase [ubiquinone] 1 alpha subcomplex subunit 13 n=1 Tax=Arcella intermedia TaxID=1963864 RepID=A0A6B2LTT5_9EUKA
MFPEVEVTRRTRFRGVPGIYLFTGCIAAMVYGHWVAMGTVRKRLRAQKEMEEARINVLPLLIAEEDRHYLRVKRQMVEDEKKYFSNNPDWVPGAPVYHTRWMPPASYPVANW